MFMFEEKKIKKSTDNLYRYLFKHREFKRMMPKAFKQVLLILITTIAHIAQ